MNDQLQPQTEARAAPSGTPASSGLLQRKCAFGEQTPAGREYEKRHDRDPVPLRRAAVSSEPVRSVPPLVGEVLRSSGQPLDTPTRAFFEPRFGHDFSRIRVHTDARAVASAQEAGARAYTIGSHIAFGSGQYAPHTVRGKRLLAHELTHVLQQISGADGSDQHLEARAREQEAVPSSPPRMIRNGVARRNERIQLNPDRITSITVNLHASSVAIELDSGEPISGSVSDTNLAPGNYQCRWDSSSGGLVIDPWPTTDQVIHFSVRGTTSFLRRYDRLRRDISAPIPFTVVSEGLSSIPGHPGERAQPTEGVALTREEALRRCQANDPPGIKVFPFRATRFGAAPISARRDGDDVLVEQPVYVLANDDFRGQTRTLPTETFISGVRLRPNDIVRVHVYEPRWYHLNITGSTEGDTEQEFCVTGEQMLEISAASSTATLGNIGVTVVEAATLFIPVGRFAGAAARPLLQTGRTGLAAAMIGTADVVAPRAVSAAAPRAAITVVEEQVVTRAAGRSLVKTAAHTVVEAGEHGIISQAVPRSAAAVPPRLTSSAVAHVAGTGTLEAAAEVGGGTVRSAAAGIERGGVPSRPPSQPGRPSAAPGGPAPVPTSGVRLTTVTGDQVIVDTNIARALDKAARGLPLQPSEQLMVAAARQQGIVVTDRTVAELAVRGGVKGTALVSREVAVTQAERQTITRALEAAGVGGGAADREIVLQALLSRTTSGVTPTFATADRGIINALARLAGIDPARLGRYRTVAEYLFYQRGTNTFEVLIEGRRLIVMPIQAVRAGL